MLNSMPVRNQSPVFRPYINFLIFNYGYGNQLSIFQFLITDHVTLKSSVFPATEEQDFEAKLLSQMLNSMPVRNQSPVFGLRSFVSGLRSFFNSLILSFLHF
jgi:hypothetical protein